MINYKRLALAALLALSRSSTGEAMTLSQKEEIIQYVRNEDAILPPPQKEERIQYVRDDVVTGFGTPMDELTPKSNAEERMGTLTELISSFEAAKNLVEGNADWGEERLDVLVAKLRGFEPAMDRMKSEMVAEDADASEWEKLAATQKAYAEVLESVARIKRSIVNEKRMNAYANFIEEGEEDAPEVESVEQAEESDMNEKRMNAYANFIEKEEEKEVEVPESRKEERMDTLDELSASFANAKMLIVDGDRLNKDNLEETTKILYSIQDVFENIETEMLADEADAEEWGKFNAVQKDYAEFLKSVVEKAKESSENAPAETERVEGDSSERLETLAKQLSEVNEALLSDGDVGSLQHELDDVRSQIKEMEPNEAVLKLDTVVTLLDQALKQKVAALEVEEEEKSVEVAETEQQEEEDSELLQLAKILSDVNEALLSDRDLDSLQHELDYVRSQVKEMEPNEEVSKMNQAITLLGKALEQKLATLEVEEEEKSVEVTEAEQEKDDSQLEPLVEMLSDIQKTLLSDGDLGSLELELDYVRSQIGEMEPDESVSKMNEVVTLLNQALEQKLAARHEVKVEEHFEVEDEKHEELASAMSKLGFPETKIDQVKSILVDEEEAYEVNEEEKDDLKKDETEV